MNALLSIKLKRDQDAVAVRQAARHLARMLGFEHHDQIRITTAVSELVRAAMGEDGAEALAEFLVTKQDRPQRLVVRVSGRHLGETAARDSERVRSGKVAAQRLLDRFEAGARSPDTVALARALPSGAPAVTSERARSIGREIERLESVVTEGYLAELKQQNQELSSTLLELERKQEELTRLNLELADTNRGVMALYAELDERANHLRRADELKTKFLSNMSHEFRTPLNSIRMLAKILLEQTDGPLNNEQAHQVQLIHDASNEMFELVSDLLDLAKVEAGKSDVHVGAFSVPSLFGALRGMMRPLLRTDAVSLELDAGTDLPSLIGDEGKIAQILRNFLSNAVKFTQSGTIRVSAERIPAGGRVPGLAEPASVESILFCVADTGIGISRDDQAFIFDEFTQVRHALQGNVRGTGLGLPLCRRLATLMDGHVWVDSELGAGSSFYLLVPRLYHPLPAQRPAAVVERPPSAARPRLPLLIVADAEAEAQRLRQLFENTSLAPVIAAGGDVTAEYLGALRPCAALVHAPSAPSALSDELRRANVRSVDVGALQPAPSDPSERDAALVEDVYREVLKARASRLLILDDEASFRLLLAKYVQSFCVDPVVTGDPWRALAAVEGAVDCMILDLIMPDMDGFTMLALLRDTPSTASLPVLVCSSKTLTPDEAVMLREMRASFLTKNDLAASRLAEALVDAIARSTATASLPAQPAAEAVA